MPARFPPRSGHDSIHRTVGSPVSVVYPYISDPARLFQKALSDIGVDLEYTPDFGPNRWGKCGMMVVRVRYRHPIAAIFNDPGAGEWHLGCYELEAFEVPRDQTGKPSPFYYTEFHAFDRSMTDQRVQITTRLGDGLGMEALKVLGAAALARSTGGELSDECGNNVKDPPLDWAMERLRKKLKRTPRPLHFRFLESWEQYYDNAQEICPPI